ncbi:MAG: hypothetical protein IPH36_17420 [Saprospiraceae bacterium]|nr:hypothetical protein [Saprospiraceae bacterium]
MDLISLAAVLEKRTTAPGITGLRPRQFTSNTQDADKGRNRAKPRS